MGVGPSAVEELVESEYWRVTGITRWDCGRIGGSKIKFWKQ